MTNLLSVLAVWSSVQGTNIAGYHLYQGPASHSYTNSYNAGPHTNYSVSNLVRGATYYFAVTAVSAEGLESEFSPEATWPLPVTNVASVGVQVLSSTNLAGTNLANWTPIASLPVLSLTNPTQPQFFRASMTITQSLLTGHVLKLDSSTLAITNR